MSTNTCTHIHRATSICLGPHSLCAFALTLNNLQALITPLCTDSSPRLPKPLDLITGPNLWWPHMHTYTCTHSSCCITDTQALWPIVWLQLLHSDSHIHRHNEQSTLTQKRVKEESSKRTGTAHSLYWPAKCLHVASIFYTFTLLFSTHGHSQIT